MANYQNYDSSYSPDSFQTHQIDSLRGRDDFILGADISLSSAITEAGGAYFDKEGVRDPICKILKDAGLNTARIRLFHDYASPDGTLCGKLDLSRIISMVREAKQYGLHVLLDFHYSDSWADPENQTVPYAWRNDTYQGLLNEVRGYTKSVLEGIQSEGLSVDYVQIGNEIDNGLLFPFGQIDWDSREEGYDKVAEILSEGTKATREVFPQSKTIIHTANALYRWEYGEDWGNKSMEFFEALESRNVDYDIIGASFYTFVDETPISLISDAIDLYGERIGKPVLIMETSYGYTLEWNEYTSNVFHEEWRRDGYPISFQGQTNLILDMVEEVAKAKDHGGLGVCYWGGEWIPNSDSSMRTSWANQALFTYEGVATPTLYAFGQCRP